MPSYEAIVSAAVSSGDTLSVAQENLLRDKVNHLNRNFNQRRSIDETTDTPVVKYIPLLVTSKVAAAAGFYKVKRFLPVAFPDNSSALAESDLGSAGTDDEAYGIRLGDLGGSTHGLPANSSVYCVGLIFSYHADGKPIYLLLDADPRPVIVRVDGDATGGGKYFGWRLQSPAGVVSESGNLAASDSGAVPTDADGTQSDYDVLICNLHEQGQSTHDLTAGTQKVTDFIGYTHNQLTTDGKLVVYINGTDWEDCS